MADDSIEPRWKRFLRSSVVQREPSSTGSRPGSLSSETGSAAPVEHAAPLEPFFSRFEHSSESVHAPRGASFRRRRPAPLQSSATPPPDSRTSHNSSAVRDDDDEIGGSGITNLGPSSPRPTSCGVPSESAQMPTTQKSRSETAESSSAAMLAQPETRPISQEQLVAEVKGIYEGLVMVETKCIEVDNAQTCSRLDNEQWQALIELHRTLLHEHHEFLLASQHPAASSALRRLASKYAMPARMWRHGIHSFLELLRHRLPESLNPMLTFIYLAYLMMALLYETVPAFEDTWIERIGDLRRYRVEIEDDNMHDREVWTNVARHWYSEASASSPSTGRLYHHLGILARPNARQQLYYHANSLAVPIPFMSARDSVMTLFDPLLSATPGAPARLELVDAALVQSLELLFSRHTDRLPNLEFVPPGHHVGTTTDVRLEQETRDDDQQPSSARVSQEQAGEGSAHPVQDSLFSRAQRIWHLLLEAVGARLARLASLGSGPRRRYNRLLLLPSLAFLPLGSAAPLDESRSDVRDIESVIVLLLIAFVLAFAYWRHFKSERGIKLWLLVGLELTSGVAATLAFCRGSEPGSPWAFILLEGLASSLHEVIVSPGSYHWPIKIGLCAFVACLAAATSNSAEGAPVVFLEFLPAAYAAASLALWLWNRRFRVQPEQLARDEDGQVSDPASNF